MSPFVCLIRWARLNLARFHADRFGTTLTELLITLPVFILIFGGVYRLGQIHSKAIVTEGVAYKNTFNKALDVQGLDVGDGLTGLLQGSSSAVHMAPPVAAADAIVQLETYQPRQKNTLTRGAIKLAEHTTYSFDGLVLSGHFGESYSRVRPLQMFDVGFLGLSDEAPTANPEDLLGGSYLSRDLLYDGPNVDFQGGGFNTSNPFQSIYGMLNGMISMSGARGALAANMRYGTVTGVDTDQLDMGYRVIDFESYYNVSVPTYLGSEPWFDQMRAMVITRFTMANPDYALYNKPFGFKGAPDLQLGNGPLDVPEKDEIRLTSPVNYNADTLQ
ncbi:hypothetical protein FIV42_08055 [Persicimonas caeni]|uniref:Uncharacterized protein n=1 Tax=Persicimonas caeni TaxID=2292766 RepID=A0A4Y6PR34_PERCE|nr:hypothetical protein [Persicimonas caeni]QDG50683.1 hypothetical protein FIV42_08055 [Persicimonas caeni]QED31904.1 hypothetical protein FRD00_08050 [Persicimonas caeni]